MALNTVQQDVYKDGVCTLQDYQSQPQGWTSVPQRELLTSDL